MQGVVAAGHPLPAEAGAQVLREGGNAVDAALAAMYASFVCEPLLTGLGTGDYMLVRAPGGDDVLLDFFVEAPGCGGDPNHLVKYHIRPSASTLVPHGSRIVLAVVRRMRSSAPFIALAWCPRQDSNLRHTV